MVFVFVMARLWDVEKWWSLRKRRLVMKDVHVQSPIKTYEFGFNEDITFKTEWTMLAYGKENG